MSIKHVANSAAGNAQECAPGQSIEKPAHEQGLDILCHRAWNQPDQEQREGDYVNDSASIELFEVSFPSLS